MLISDDNEGHRRLLEMLLTSYQYEVISTQDGHEALTYLQSATPDLMILDVEMPFMTGLELCKRVRRLRRLQAIPVLIMTAVDRPDLDRQADQAGATRIMHKPIRGQNLRKIVGELVGAQ